MFSRILVAIDTTPHSEAILEQARDLAVATGASVEIIHFIGHDWIEGQDLTMEDKSRSQEQVNHALLSLTEAGITAGADPVGADARSIGKQILQRARTGPDQLIILGSRHHHAWMAFLGTSISDQIAHQSPCPVLLVPQNPAPGTTPSTNTATGGWNE